MNRNPFLLMGLLALTAHGQVTFPIIALPHQTGDYNHAYLATNVDVSALLGNTGGPQRWDFSQPRGSNEVIQRMDIVSPRDGGNEASFPRATYAERVTNQSSGDLVWSYYQIVTNVGREYYGFVDTNANPDAPGKVFDAPTVDLPATIQFGQTWTRSVDFSDFAVFINFEVHFTGQASVDAFGTVSLPNLGDMPALRVNEVDEYDYTDVSFGIYDYTNYFRDYYWLVPGVGEAVEIISPAGSVVPPENLTLASTMTRVFDTGAVQPNAAPVSRLGIHLQNGQVILGWDDSTNVSGYRVESTSDLGSGNWVLSAEPFANSWTEAPGTNAQQFFRVVAEP